MTGDQWITLAFVVMVWTVLAGSPQLRQHMGNLSIAGFIGACVGVAVRSGLESWAPTASAFLLSVGAFAAVVWAYMWLAIRGDWNAPNELAELSQKMRRGRTDEQPRDRSRV